MQSTKRRSNPAVWHFINSFLIVLIALAGLLFVALTFYPEWMHRRQLAARLEEEREKLKSEQLLQQKRAREVWLLKNDPGYVETIARDRLGLMKEGETIFRLEAGKPATPAPTPRQK